MVLLYRVPNIESIKAIAEDAAEVVEMDGLWL